MKAAIRLTTQVLAEGREAIYEATSIHPETGAYSRIDILRKCTD